jgi:hypothetical protein
MKSLTIPLKFKVLQEVDFNLLFFFVAILQGNILIKLVALFISLLLNYKLVRSGLTNRLQLFYLSLFFLSIIYGIAYSFFAPRNYLISLSVTLLSWLICIYSLLVVYSIIKRSSVERIKNTLETFFFICICMLVIQYFHTVYFYKHLNPFSVSPAAGDHFTSIFSNSSVNMIVMSFFLVYFAYQRKMTLALMAFISMLMTGYMAGITIFVFALLALSFLSPKISLGKKISFILLTLACGLLFILFSPQNYNYAAGYIERIVRFEKDVPFKILSFAETIKYNFSSVSSLLFGAGPGNFSSRAAFTVSGTYVNWYSESLTYTSKAFEANHLALWTYDFNNPWDNRNNTANQPFSFYNQLLGEYGFLGLITFLFFYIGFFIKNKSKLRYSKYLLFPLLGYFVLDYWHEYFSVIILFETLVLLDMKENEANKG